VPWVLLAVALAVSFAIRIQVPEVVLANAGHDDQLQVRLAHTLRGGQWLGPFDTLILAKGPGYPIFIWLTSDLGLPIKAAEGLVQVLAALLVALVVARLGGGGLLAAMAGALVAFDPAYLGDEASRLNRTAFYSSVCLALVAATALAAMPARGTGGRVRLVGSILGQAVVGVVVGVLGAVYWVTREERPWLLPTLVVVAAGLLLLGVRRRPGAARWRVLAPPLVALVAAAAVALGAVAQITERNQERYGFAGVSDFAEGGFPELYKALSAVDVNSPRQFVPVSAQQRSAAYTASPTFAMLRDELEVGAANWVYGGCVTYGVCDDYSGGWFAWALRDAVAAQLGPAPDARPYQAYMSQAAKEIRAACGISYACRNSGPSFVPDLRAVAASEIASATARGAVALVRFRTGQVAEAGADPAMWAHVAATVEGIAATAEEQPSTAPPGVVEWRRGLSAVLGVLLTLLAVPALAGMTVAVARGVAGSRGIGLLALAATVAVTARLGLLVIIDTTSFPAVSNGYLLPAFDLALLAVLLGTWCLAVFVVDRRRGSRVAKGPSLIERTRS